MLYILVLLLLLLIFFHFIIFYFFSLVFFIWIKWKIVLWIILFSLSISYFFARFFIEKWENSFTNLLYLCASTWLWVFISFIIFISLASIIILLLKFFNIKFDIRYIWILVIIFSSIHSIYWLWNANDIKIKTQEIEIKNLPESWKNKKILFLSDSHFWFILREKFLEKIVNLIKKEKNIDLLLISWDLFDWPKTDFSYFPEKINDLDIKDWIYLVSWNHDIYFWEFNFSDILSKTKIKLLENEVVNIDWVQLLWLESSNILNSKDKLNNALNNLSQKWFDKDIPSILLFHEPHYTKEIMDFWINLQLSWHTHDWQIWPLGYIAKFLNYWNWYGLKTIWDYSLYVTNGIGTWWPPMRVWKKPEIVILKLK